MRAITDTAVNVLARCRLLFPLLLLIQAASLQANWHSHSFEVMGTRASVELWLPATRARADALFEQVEREMQRIEALLSSYRDDSVIGQVNQLDEGQWLVVDAEVYQLLSSAQHYAMLSEGAFDITVSATGKLYDYRAQRWPDAQTLARELPQVDYRNLLLDPERSAVAFARPGMRIDLGGIAKGYAVDRSIALLRSAGVESALVAAGGDSRMLGDRGPASDEPAAPRLPWMMGIRHPRDRNQQALRLPLANTAISTSGDYERFFVREGERFHHIINPQTGRSATGLVSASVIGPHSQDCDALSTTVFVLGREKGLALINRLEDYEAVIIDGDGVVAFSDGLASDAVPAAANDPAAADARQAE